MNALTQHQRNSLKVLGFAVMCVGFFLAHTWFRTIVVRKGYELGEQRKELSALDSEWVALKVRQNRLMGPANLERLVSDFAQQGEVFENPHPSQLIYVNK